MIKITAPSLESALRWVLVAGEVDQTFVADGEIPRVSVVVVLSPDNVIWAVMIVIRQHHGCANQIHPLPYKTFIPLTLVERVVTLEGGKTARDRLFPTSCQTGGVTT